MGVVVVVVFVFLYFKFLSQNVTPLMKATLNYGLNFITHVACGREVCKEAHKVLTFWIFIAGLGNGNYIIWQTWRGKW